MKAKKKKEEKNSGNLLLMNSEYKKMPPLLKIEQKCLYKAKLHLELGQNLMKDP